MDAIKLRAENKFRTPIHGRNFQGTTTFVGALYPEGNVQVYWTWKWFDFQIETERWRGGSRWCGFQFSRQDLLIGMWGTKQIEIGLPYDFSADDPDALRRVLQEAHDNLRAFSEGPGGTLRLSGGFVHSSVCERNRNLLFGFREQKPAQPTASLKKNTSEQTSTVGAKNGNRINETLLIRKETLKNAESLQ